MLTGATDMLVCGEDLGMIPACVPPVMKDLGLIGKRIAYSLTPPHPVCHWVDLPTLSPSIPSHLAPDIHSGNPQPHVHAGLRIQRMPSEANVEFGDPATYPFLCVSSPSSHDTSTTRCWYEDNAERRQRFFEKVRSSFL
jgi:4-alpha-glucanotransferase